LSGAAAPASGAVSRVVPGAASPVNDVAAQQREQQLVEGVRERDEHISQQDVRMAALEQQIQQTNIKYNKHISQQDACIAALEQQMQDRLGLTQV
jgi:hypothetical protein